MKREKTIGRSFLYLAEEGLFRLKKEILGPRGIGVFLILFYLVADTWASAENSSNFVCRGYAAIWLILLFPPRMGKLLYLLPFSKKERIRYFFTYTCVYLFYLVAAFFLSGAIAVLMIRNSYLAWMKSFFLYTLQFVIIMGAMAVSGLAAQGTGPAYRFFSTRGWYHEDSSVADIKNEYSSGGKQKRKEKEEMTAEERRQRRNTIFETTVMIIGMLVVAVWCFAGGLIRYFSETMILVFSGVAYLCAAAVIVMLWRSAMRELNKTGSSGKEGSGCSL